MRIGTVRKGAEDRLDYDVSFAEWLTHEDTLIEAEASVVGGPDEALQVESVGVFNDQKAVKVWLNGGTAGASYTVETTITTNQGRIKTVCFRVRVMSC